MTLRRYLDPIEVQHLGAAPAHVAQYRGAVNHQSLRSSFDLLCLRHPILRGRVEPDSHGCLLYADPDHRPDCVLADGDHSVLLRQVFGPWNPAHALTRLIHVRDQDGGFVALRADHAIVDGYSMRAIFDELWELYAKMEDRLDTSVRPGTSLPRSPAELLSERWHSHPNGASSTQRPPQQRPGRTDWRRVPPRQGYIRMDEHDTSLLIDAARKHATTVHALIAGAVLVTQCAHGGHTEPSVSAVMPMVCLSPVNLRSRVAPRVGATETTGLVKIHKADIAVRSPLDPCAVGRELKIQLDSAIARRDLMSATELPAALSTPLDTPLDRRLAIVQVSNNGVVHAPLAQLTEPTILDFLSPVDLILGLFPIYSVYTFRARLSIRYLFPSNLFSDSDVMQLTDSLVAGLRTICGAEPARGGDHDQLDEHPAP